MASAGIPSAFTKPDTPTYPPLPGVFGVPSDLISVWATAQTHIWVILVYLDGLDSYIHAPELTTGDDVEPVRCACWMVRGRTLESPPEWEQNPDCPLHWAPSWLPPCTCHYGLHTAQLPYQVDRTRVRRRLVVLGSYFTIDPWCPHHAPVRAGGWEAFPDRPADDVLDEDERRGH